jgi:hypothetical protein
MSAGEDTILSVRLSSDDKLELITKNANGAHESGGLVVAPSGTRAHLANSNGGNKAGRVTVFLIRSRTLIPLVKATPTGSAGSERSAKSVDGRSL